jgi:hypothetical protein
LEGIKVFLRPDNTAEGTSHWLHMLYYPHTNNLFSQGIITFCKEPALSLPKGEHKGILLPELITP